ncbi:hypothetical protein WMF28_15655 [Sorangium sp. So ce590]|uniref:hypothetical protein n=1 Tax=Sorangium sp. So ce590 TaxID=3133317 RepID=UPI003F5DD6E8
MSIVGRPPAPPPNARAPHPATVAQPRPALGGVAPRPPHPATVAQPRPALGGMAPRPPHPATVAQPRPALGGMAPRPPHPATVAQPEPAIGEALQPYRKGQRNRGFLDSKKAKTKADRARHVSGVKHIDHQQRAYLAGKVDASLLDGPLVNLPVWAALLLLSASLITAAEARSIDAHQSRQPAPRSPQKLPSSPGGYSNSTALVPVGGVTDVCPVRPPLVRTPGMIGGLLPVPPRSSTSQIGSSELVELLPAREVALSPGERLTQSIFEAWRPKVKALGKRESLKPIYKQLATFRGGGARLSAISGGDGGAYFLKAGGKTGWVVKPGDEDLMCPNNRKGFGYDGKRLHAGIPVHTAVQREVATHHVANRLGLGHLVPGTVAAVFDGSGVFSTKGPKLCSAQQFLPGIMGVGELRDELVTRLRQGGAPIHEAADSATKLIDGMLDENDFADMMVLNWLTHDNDAHGGNCVVHVKAGPGVSAETPLPVKDLLKKPVDEMGKYKLGMKKIDNGLAMPEENTNGRNYLSVFPKFKQPVSARVHDKLEAWTTSAKGGLTPVKAVAEELDELDLNPEGISTAGDAMVDRIRKYASKSKTVQKRGWSYERFQSLVGYVYRG